MLYRFGGKQPTVGKDSYVSDLATVIGDVVIGVNCYIGHGAILRGDYGRIEIGDYTAVEEGAIIHAPPGDTNRIGTRVTIGHGAVIHGKYIGNQAVIGMGSILSIWSEIGERYNNRRGHSCKIEAENPSKSDCRRQPGTDRPRAECKRRRVLELGQTALCRSCKKILG